MTQVLECAPIDFGAVKDRQQAMWASGDFAIIGTTLQLVGESLCEVAGARAGSLVLDVACGNGNAALAAARRFCDVTAIDYVPALLARAQERARAERQSIRFLEADAERLPFADGSYDLVLSTFGVMFAPDQRRAAHELLRVCKPGGRIALTSWTPEGFIGEVLRMVGRYVPPAPGLASPLQWGSPRALARLFGADAAVIHAQRKDFAFRYRSPQHFVETFRRFYGPTLKAFEALDANRQAALAAELTQLASARNVDRNGALNVQGEYLECVLELSSR
jgi:ubiquinone/menaquinone biosynthesis C-methylase UbiE